jgi:quinol monooxygenase YgiN
MLALASQVRANEPGNHLYTLCKDADGNYLMLELYENEAALAAHGQSEHFRASGRSFKGLMAGAPQIQRLQVIG